MKIVTDQKKIDEIFARGTVVEAFPSKDALTSKLLSGEPMRIYYGLDPTFTAIHLGHAKNLIFLEELRQLGHEDHHSFRRFYGTDRRSFGQDGRAQATFRRRSKEEHGRLDASR